MQAPSSNPKPPVVVPGSGNNIILNPLQVLYDTSKSLSSGIERIQRGNPVLDCIRNVGKEYGDIVADYQVGRTTGVLFLSLKYHRLHPEYIHTRIEKLGHSYSLRVLLILSDITEHKDAIRELTKVCLINNLTVIVAFSFEEAGHYLSVFKQFEYKPPNMIKERVDKDYTSMLRTSLTSISKVNKTDVETLRSSFGSIANIAKTNSDQLANLPGFGQVKVKNIKNAFEKPFRNHATNTLALMASSQLQAEVGDENTPSASVVSEDKRKAISTHKPSTSSSNRPLQDPSPPLNIAPESSSPHFRSPARPRTPSPVWDIELDLN